MRIGVVARLDVDEAVELAGKIVEFLIEKDVETLLDISTWHANSTNIMKLPQSLEDMDVDMVVAVGGDGTVLRTQGFINKKKIPLFGINMGAVGFLTEIDPEDALNALEQVLAGKYFVEKRTQLTSMAQQRTALGTQRSCSHDTKTR